MELCIIGLNHRTTPVQFRERFAVPAEQVPALLGKLRVALHLEEVAVLSTCNRLEVYCVSSGAAVSSAQVFELIGALKGQPASAEDIEQALNCQYVHRNGACVRHLFRVTSSLDSLVVGETEIVGQVKKAYQLAQEAKSTGKALNRLFQKALSVSKEVRTRSGIGRCSTSVGSVALDLANKIFGEDLSNRTILIIGAGKMGETTLKHLSKHGAKSILVANRSYDRALELVSRFDATAVPFEQLSGALARADIVVSSTSAPHFVLTKSDVAAAMQQRPDRPLLLVDLAVPRDIDPAALDVNSVYVYNIDQLSELGRLNMERRQTEAGACEKMVAALSEEAAETILAPRRTGADVTPAWTGGSLMPLLQPA